MKILTLNTHSLIEENYEKKFGIFLDGIRKMKPDVLLLQEVNQSADKQVICSADRLCALGCIPLREDNHALRAAYALSDMGMPYHMTWLGIKKGFGKFDEGIAMLSLMPIKNASCVCVSKADDYNNWKTRKALVANTFGMNICTTHMGWWHDNEEPFEKQFLRLDNELRKSGCTILAGDFNSPDTARCEGYDLVLSKGWTDAYKHAASREGYHTVSGPIAGWNNDDNMRIDYIFTRGDIQIKNCCTVFDGCRYNIVSDHFGVMADIERDIK